jgi:hypothetical protein
MVLEGETEVLGENLPRLHFVHHKSQLPDPGVNPGRRGGKPATNRFSYGAAKSDAYVHKISLGYQPCQFWLTRLIAQGGFINQF